MTSPTPEPSQSTEAPTSVPWAVLVIGGNADGDDIEVNIVSRAGGSVADPDGGHWFTYDEAEYVVAAVNAAAARPEPPVEGALEAARQKLFERSSPWDWQDESWLAALDDVIAAARSGHDGLRALFDALNVLPNGMVYVAEGQSVAFREAAKALAAANGITIKDHPARALTSDPAPVAPGGA